MHGRDFCCSSAFQKLFCSLVSCWARRTESGFKAFFSPERGAHYGQEVGEIGV